MAQSRQPTESPRDSTPQAVRSKRSYSKPTLFDFGTLRQITLQGGNTGADDGTPGVSKTSPG